MTITSIVSLAAAMLVLAATPGPGIFATVSRALSSGTAAALDVIAGIITGDLIFLMFAIFGMAFIAQTAGQLFFIIRMLGAAYLFYLGFQIWRSAPETDSGTVNQALNHGGGHLGRYISGLLITLSNPKVILFYCGFLPTFIDLTVLELSDVIIVALVVSGTLFWVLMLYALLAGKAGRALKSGRAMKVLHRTAGSIMMGAGVAIGIKGS